MRNILTITGRELKSYFVSPLAYVIIAAVTALLGYLFTAYVLQTRQSSMQNTFELIIFLMLFFAPAFTMRLMAEETRQGTLELLLTAPIRDWEIVLGKYIASLVLFLALLVPTLWQVALLVRYTSPGSPDFGPILSGYLGTFLVAMMFLAIGLMMSSLTQNQVVAYILAIMVLVLFWILDAASSVATGPIGDLIRYLTVRNHYGDFTTGLIDTNQILYFVGISAIALFITTRVVEARRWR